MLENFKFSDSLITNGLIWVICGVGLIFAWRMVNKSLNNESGKKILHNLKGKRVTFLEILLAFISFLAATITAYVAEGEVHFALRWLQHFSISAMSAVMGFAIFEEVSEAIRSFVKIFEPVPETARMPEWAIMTLRFIDAVKQTLVDLFFTVGFAIGGPLINFFVMLKYTKELEKFTDVLAGRYYNLGAWWKAGMELQGLSFTEMCMTGGHIFIVIFLAGASFDTLRTEYLTFKPRRRIRAKISDMLNYFEKRTESGLEIDKDALEAFIESDKFTNKHIVQKYFEKHVKTMAELESDETSLTDNQEENLRNKILVIEKELFDLIQPFVE